MNKHLLVVTLAFVVLNALPAHAVSVGDSATSDITIVENGKTKHGVMKQAITAYNPNSKQYELVMDSELEGVPFGHSDTWIGEVELTRIETYQKKMYEECAANNGVVEAVTLVAGTFKACKRVFTHATVWTAALPYLCNVREENDLNGTKVTYALRAFTMGLAAE